MLSLSSMEKELLGNRCISNNHNNYYFLNLYLRYFFYSFFLFPLFVSSFLISNFIPSHTVKYFVILSLSLRQRGIQHYFGRINADSENDRGHSVNVTHTHTHSLSLSLSLSHMYNRAVWYRWLIVEAEGPTGHGSRFIQSM